MTDLSDSELLERYVRGGSETAFAELVERHIGLVHSVALRRTACPECAQDITQAVFIILARKAATLSRRTILPGWLYQTARWTAANLRRAEASRARREQEAYMQSIQEDSPEALWAEIAPQLEEAMARLGNDERDAIVLRYFQNKSFSEVGELIGKGESAAKKRVQRAVEKLRAFFHKRGLDTAADAVTRTISLHSIQPAPLGLAKTVTAVALAKGMTVSTTTATLIKGALKIMAWTKAKTAIVATVVVLLTGGTATVTVEKIRQRDLDAQWDTGQADPRSLGRLPRIVRIIPTRFPNGGGGFISRSRSIAFGLDVREMLQAAYGSYYNRTIFLTPMPPGRYDFIANLPSGSSEALGKEMQKQLGIVGRVETVETNVMFLKVSQSGAAGLLPSNTPNEPASINLLGPNVTARNMDLGGIAIGIEARWKIPVIDQTGIRGRYDFDFKLGSRNDPDLANFKQALRDQLGLELVPDTAPVKFLFVEKTK